MSDPRHQHGSGVRPVGEYAPGGTAVNPYGTSKGVRAVPVDVIPPARRERRGAQEARQREAERATQPRRRGRPVGSRNRPPIDPEMFDAPPDEG